MEIILNGRIEDGIQNNGMKAEREYYTSTPTPHSPEESEDV